MIHSSLKTMILELMETMIYLVIRVTGLSYEENLIFKKSFLSNTKTINQTIFLIKHMLPVSLSFSKFMTNAVKPKNRVPVAFMMSKFESGILSLRSGMRTRFSKNKNLESRISDILKKGIISNIESRRF